MADIKFYCPECGSKLGVDSSAAGYLVNCPDCGANIEIPAESSSAPPPSANPNLTQRIPGLEQDVAGQELREQTEKLRQQVETEQAQAAQAKAERDQLQSNFAELQAGTDAAVRHATELEAQLKKKEREVEGLTTRVGEEVKKATNLSASLMSMKEESANLKKAADELRAEKAEQPAARTEELEQHNQALAGQLEEAQKELARLAGADAAAADVQAEAARLATRLAETEEKAAAAEQRISQLDQVLAEERSKVEGVAEVKAAVQQLQGSAVQLREENLRLSEELTKARSKAEEEELLRTSFEEDKVRKEVDKYRREVVALQERKTSAEARASVIAEDNTKLERELSALKAQLHEAPPEKLPPIQALEQILERPPPMAPLLPPSVEEAQAEAEPQPATDGEPEVVPEPEAVPEPIVDLPEVVEMDPKPVEEQEQALKSPPEEEEKESAALPDEPPKEEQPAPAEQEVPPAPKPVQKKKEKKKSVRQQRRHRGPRPPETWSPGQSSNKTAGPEADSATATINSLYDGHKQKPGAVETRRATKPRSPRGKGWALAIVVISLVASLSGALVNVLSPGTLSNLTARLTALVSGHPLGGPAADSNPSEQQASGLRVGLATPVLIDGISVTVDSATIEKVARLDALGREVLSDRPYLVLHLSLENVTDDETIFMLHTWEQSMLADNQENIVRPAFRSRFTVDQVVGTLTATEIAPGQKLEDKLAFEAPPENATEFVLTSDPGFWKATTEGAHAPASHRVIKVVFSKEELAPSESTEDASDTL